MSKTQAIVPVERIESRILLIRGHKVMLDSDLAGLYGVRTAALTRAVRRNRSRFPADFMFRLNKQEFANLRSQFGTTSQWGGRRYAPYAGGSRRKTQKGTFGPMRRSPPEGQEKARPGGI